MQRAAPATAPAAGYRPHPQTAPTRHRCGTVYPTPRCARRMPRRWAGAVR